MDKEKMFMELLGVLIDSPVKIMFEKENGINSAKTEISGSSAAVMVGACNLIEKITNLIAKDNKELLSIWVPMATKALLKGLKESEG